MYGDWGYTRFNRICSKFWTQSIAYIHQTIIVYNETLFGRIRKNMSKDSLVRQEIHEGQPGYYPKNLIRYRSCNAFHDEGLRCTRMLNHKGPHAAHVVMGVPGTTEEVKNDQGEVIDVRVKTGMKNTEDVQIATW